MRRKAWFFLSLAIVLGIGQLTGLVFGGSWIYTTTQLEAARKFGVFSTPVEGMQQLINRGYRGIQKVEIVDNGPNSFDGSDPHIWFVTARVWAERRADGSLMHGKGYDVPGCYFLHGKDGWVHVGEGYFPEFIGYWMKVYELAGDEQS